MTGCGTRCHGLDDKVVISQRLVSMIPEVLSNLNGSVAAVPGEDEVRDMSLKGDVSQRNLRDPCCLQGQSRHHPPLLSRIRVLEKGHAPKGEPQISCRKS